MMKSKIVAFFLTALVGACSCESGKRVLPDVGPNSFIRYSSGLSVPSALLGKNISFDILLPADYLSNPEKRYPVVYMCHGLGDDNTSWNDKWLRVEEKVKELEAKGLEPMIYVFPNANRTYYVNKFNGKYPYMDMFVTELVPFIDRTYRTIADREHRATVGYSMGGFGAYVLAAKHPEVFSISVPLSMSFRTDEQYMSESQDGWNYQWASNFGGENQTGEGRLTDYYKEHCPLYLFNDEDRHNLDSVHWFLHCGDDEEQLLIANDDLHVLMRNNGFKHEYRVADGAHTSGYWRNSLEEVLPYIQFVMAGGESWNAAWKEVRPVDVALEGDGCFCSPKYKESEDTGTAFFIAHDGLSAETIRNVISIIQRTTSRNYVIVPCDLSASSLGECVRTAEEKYHIGGDASKRHILAIGGAGAKVMSAQEQFGKLYFEDASLPEGFRKESLRKDKFYYIGQHDLSEHYAEMGSLYKACKKAEVPYEYRCRNNSEDAQTAILAAIEVMKPYFTL